jgi:hypothetical protein
MRNGNKEQRSQIGVFKIKVLLYSYDVMESIDSIVKSKDLLLKTASNLYFNENACCNDRNTVRALDYFASENETIRPHIKMMEGWVAILKNVRELSRASIIFHPLKTGIRRADLPLEHYEENIYGAFIHYCNLDRDVPIPEEMRGLISEKPADYNVRLSIADKIELLKSQGKRFTLTHLHQLMEIVHRRNRVHVNQAEIRPRGDRVSGLSEFLEYMDTQDAPLCEKPLCRLMRAVLDTYNPKTMVAEDSESTRRLNNYLTKANEEMLTAIAGFFQTYGNLTAKNFGQLTTMLANIHIWNMESESSIDKNHTMFTVMQFMKTSVINMTKTYPELIRNKYSPTHDVSKKWGFSANHSNDLGQVIRRFYEPLQSLRGDEVIPGLLADAQSRLADLNTFLHHIPSFSPIVRKVEDDAGLEHDTIFYSLFSRRTLYMLHSYAWYSTLYEYILKSDDLDLLQMDIQSRKMARRQAKQEKEDVLGIGSSREVLDTENFGDELDVRVEQEIVVGNQRELKVRVAKMLLAFLDMENGNKGETDMSYKDIDSRIRISKQQEKKMITDFFRNMDSDERQVEYALEMQRLGRWDVGMQKGLVHYDKDTYDRERNELFMRLNDPLATAADDIDAVLNSREVDDLEAEADADADAAGDQEAYDIGGLGEEYGDGNYYEENVDDQDDEGFGY